MRVWVDLTNSLHALVFRLGAVDERLVDQGRLRRMESADQIVLAKGRRRTAARVQRDRDLLADLLLAGVGDGGGA